MRDIADQIDSDISSDEAEQDQAGSLGRIQYQEAEREQRRTLASSRTRSP